MIRRLSNILNLTLTSYLSYLSTFISRSWAGLSGTILMASGSQLPPTGSAASTQFTTSVLATVACKCERSHCGQTIEPGQHRYYFANVIENHPGKWVCGPCYHYYLRKVATTTTCQRQSEPEHDSAIGGNHGARTLPDSASIR